MRASAGSGGPNAVDGQPDTVSGAGPVQWVELALWHPLEAIGYIGVETLASPSRVAWPEISVLGS